MGKLRPYSDPPSAHRGTIVIAGSMAQMPGHGGHAWVFLQYLLGFRSLGWDVLFLDALDTNACTDESGRICAATDSRQAHYLHEVMTQFGLGESYAILLGTTGSTIGIRRPALIERLRHAAFFVNVMGFIRDDEILAAAPRRVFLDIDPGFGQMWQALGLADIFAGHDDFVTIGENIGQPDCRIPTCGLRWITTPQPVVLEQWPTTTPPPQAPLTSVATWRGIFGPVEYEGTVYGLRVHEFRKFATLPTRIPFACELALAIHANDEKDLALLKHNSWRITDPNIVAANPSKYRSYIQQSAAEFMVAKGMYVQARSGWLSDRSLCYLASGRPVIAQDTGLDERYLTKRGLLAFRSVDEAVENALELHRDYASHARAARELAETYFDSNFVLTRFLTALSIN
ncbi:MAG: hypothetical protein ACJ8C4_06900 [Gemmataceae bacterium]